MKLPILNCLLHRMSPWAFHSSMVFALAWSCPRPKVRTSKGASTLSTCPLTSKISPGALVKPRLHQGWWSRSSRTQYLQRGFHEGSSIAGWFRMKNPWISCIKMDDSGVPPHFRKPPYGKSPVRFMHMQHGLPTFDSSEYCNIVLLLWKITTQNRVEWIKKRAMVIPVSYSCCGWSSLAGWIPGGG